jgi:hypothetical protein
MPLGSDDRRDEQEYAGLVVSQVIADQREVQGAAGRGH